MIKEGGIFAPCTANLREWRLNSYPHTTRKVFFLAAILACLMGPVSAFAASDGTELLRYEVTWNGNKAGHGDISTKKDAKTVNVTAQAVSDGVVKTLIEMWSRIQATFSAKTLQPLSYNFAFKSNLGSPELVTLTFDHKTKLVQVDKQRGTERENHAEQFSGLYDPISAAFLLRNQKDYTKPMFVDIFDGKDKSRLFVTYAGNEKLKVQAGLHPAVCLNLRLMKLTGDKKEVGNGKLWISDDQHRVPLCLTSSPLLGTIKFELVQLVHAQL
jgi:hypothetical protein